MTVRKLGKKHQVKQDKRPGRLSIDGLGQDPMRILKLIQAGSLDPHALPKRTRMGLLLVMANGKQTSTEIAGFFGVSAALIRQELTEVRQTLGTEVKTWSLETILGRLSMAAEKCTALAHKQEDPGLAWSIERDFARSLKELGITGQGAVPGGRLTLTLEGVGEGYERAAQALRMGMDPRLTGAIVEGEVVVKDDQPVLPLERTLDGQRQQASPGPSGDDQAQDEPSDEDDLDADQE